MWVKIRMFRRFHLQAKAANRLDCLGREGLRVPARVIHSNAPGRKAAASCSTPKRPQGGAQAFTLVELLIALTVLALLAGLTVPAIDGIQKERLAREPVDALHRMARAARGRAMAEQRPYQIAFDGSGFRVARFFSPYPGPEEFETRRIELRELDRLEEMREASRQRGIQVSPEEEPDPRMERLQEGMRYFEEYSLPPGVRLSLRFWGDTDWQEMSAGQFRRWVFQPSGMSEPILVRVERENAFFEVEFHPLTADVKRERSWVE